MPGSVDDLSFGVYPPAIDISTSANPQVFNPQFSVANIGTTETVSFTRALLLVPVTTNVTNLAQNTDMTPNAITPGWTLSRAAAPPSDQGYDAFAPLPMTAKARFRREAASRAKTASVPSFCTEVAHLTRFERVTFAFGGQRSFAATRGMKFSMNRKKRCCESRW